MQHPHPATTSLARWQRLLDAEVSSAPREPVSVQYRRVHMHSDRADPFMIDGERVDASRVGFLGMNWQSGVILGFVLAFALRVLGVVA